MKTHSNTLFSYFGNMDFWGFVTKIRREKLFFRAAQYLELIDFLLFPFVSLVLLVKAKIKHFQLAGFQSFKNLPLINKDSCWKYLIEWNPIGDGCKRHV